MAINWLDTIEIIHVELKFGQCQWPDLAQLQSKRIRKLPFKSSFIVHRASHTVNKDPFFLFIKRSVPRSFYNANHKQIRTAVSKR